MIILFHILNVKYSITMVVYLDLFNSAQYILVEWHTEAVLRLIIPGAIVYNTDLTGRGY